jgi:hypothetical protein
LCRKLAEVYVKQGRDADAEPLYRRALAIREKALGPDHADVAELRKRLASLHDAKPRRNDVGLKPEIESGFALHHEGSNGVIKWGYKGNDFAPTPVEGSPEKVWLAVEAFRARAQFDRVVLLLPAKPLAIVCNTRPPIWIDTQLGSKDAGALIALNEKAGGKTIGDYAGAILLHLPSERRSAATEPSLQRLSAVASDQNKVSYLRKRTQPGKLGGVSTYEEYKAESAQAARQFLLTKQVKEPNYYIVVETLEGGWGLDVEGLYLERLAPWQTDISLAEVEGRTGSGSPSQFALDSARRCITDNFVHTVICGKCGEEWQDGLRYQAVTVVKCPHCNTKNSVSSRHYTASPGEPDRLAPRPKPRRRLRSWLNPFHYLRRSRR